MADLSVRRGASLQSPVSASEDAPVQGSRASTPPPPTTDASRAEGRAPRNYIVFSPLQVGLRPPGRAGGTAREGHLPSGEPWHTELLTPSDAEALRQRKVRVIEDQPFFISPPQRSLQATPATPLTGLDYHEITTLHARGPEWQGQGGLFIDIDTGVGDHADAKRPARYYDVLDPTAGPRDPGQHGTMTWTEVMGQGDPETGGIRGGAPLAEGAAIRVLDDNGRGSTATVLKGIEKAVEWGKDYPGFVVVNMSLSGRTWSSPDADPLAQAVDQATQQGILFNIAAGNDGPFFNTIGTPGIARSAITYAASGHSGTMTTRDDGIGSFSSRDMADGPKPDVAADGVDVRVAIPGGGYERQNGTSMAAPYGSSGTLDIGSGLYAQWKEGRYAVNPRELVKSGEFQRTVAATAVPIGIPVRPHNVQGAGDFRAVAAADALLRAHAGPPPGAEPPSDEESSLRSRR